MLRTAHTQAAERFSEWGVTASWCMLSELSILHNLQISDSDSHFRKDARSSADDSLAASWPAAAIVLYAHPFGGHGLDGSHQHLTELRWASINEVDFLHLSFLFFLSLLH